MTRKDTLIRYNDPVWGRLDENGVKEILGNSVVTLEASVAAKLYQTWFPERNYTEQEALDDFMTVNWAWYVNEERTS